MNDQQNNQEKEKGKEPEKQITKYDRTKQLMQSENMLKQLANILGNRQAHAFVGSVLLVVSQSKKLMECEPMSIIASALQAANLKLSCDPSIGQAYLVPYKGKCTFVPGYRGLKDLGLRTREYSDLSINEIYAGQQVEKDQITGRLTVLGTPETDEVVAYVGYLRLLSGFSKAIFMTVEDIHKHAKRYAPSYAYPDSPWNTETPKMEAKTVLRQLLSKWGYMDPHDVLALQGYTEAGSGISPIDVRLDEEGASLEFAQPPKEAHGQAWPTSVLQEIVEAGHAQAPQHAQNILNMSKILKSDFPAGVLVAWAARYRQFRDQDLGGDEAAAESDKQIDLIKDQAK